MAEPVFETAAHSPDERLQLLRLARQSIEHAVRGDRWRPELRDYAAHLREQGVCFVTLFTQDGDLRGCIGGLEATQPLVLDVTEHAAAAALDDFRFLPVTPDEVPNLKIEISLLTHPVPLEYENPEDLSHLLRPMFDGVVLRDGTRRATFLPQVWEKLPDPAMFLSHLCQKMGAPGDLWRKRKLQVEIYHVEEFCEEK